MLHTRCILDEDDYKNIYLCKVAPENKNLSEEERDDIHDVLIKYKFLFDGTLGSCKNKPIDVYIHTNYK